MEMLTAEQRAAVDTQEGPLLIIAGAGSGKTRVVTQRIAHLVDSSVPPEQILAVTFTNKAAREMAERVCALTDSRVLVTTFHKLGALLLREAGSAVGISPNFVIYDQEDSLKLLKEVLEAHFGSKPDQAVAKRYRSAISSAKNGRLSPDATSAKLRSFATTLDAFAAIWQRYQERLVECSAVDFDDLLTKSLQLLEEHPSLLERFRCRWRYISVDEFQDTNPVQYEIVRLLSAEHRNLCVVGDPDQAIYSWRGAEISNILDFQSDWPEARVIRLEKNFRSTQKILDAANRLIAHNESRYQKKLWSDQAGIEPIQLQKYHSEREEAAHILSSVADEISAGTSPDEIALLYRTNAQSRVLEDFCLRYGIHYRIVGGLSFYQRKEIKDILSYLRLLISPGDFLAFTRAITTPKRGLGEKSLQKLRVAADESDSSLLDACKTAVQSGRKSRQKEALSSFLTLLEGAHECARLGVAEALQWIIDHSGYRAFLKEDLEHGDERQENLAELVGKASEWDEENPDGTVQQFMEEITLHTTLEEAEGLPCVTLMTLHNAKGLEFSVCYLVGIEEGLSPHANSIEGDEEVEEERRLLYVGMTRAKRQLTLSYAETRRRWGGVDYCKPSRFLGEMGLLRRRDRFADYTHAPF